MNTKNMLPKDVARQYNVKLYQLAKWLDMSHDSLYMRNFRKTPFKKHEMEYLLMKIEDAGPEVVIDDDEKESLMPLL